MPETATLILKVDLQCCRCSKKIKKVLCKLQCKARIQSIVYDEKNNCVTISGLFDPDCLSKKLRCKACRVILDIEVKKKDPPKKPPPPEKTETTRVLMKFPDCPPPPPPNNNSWPPQFMCPPGPLWPPCCQRPCPCYVEGHLGYCRCCTCGRSYNNPSPPSPPRPKIPKPPPPATPVPSSSSGGVPAAAPYCGCCSSSCRGCKVVFIDENPIVGCAVM